MGDPFRRRVLSFAVFAAFAAASLSGAGCGDDKKSVAADAGALDAGPSKALLDGKLSQAAAAAASGAGTGEAKPGAPATGDAPPPNGVFAPGDADKRQSKSAPPKIDLLGEGDEPRVLLAHKLDAAEQRTTVRVGFKMGQQMRMPTVDFSLSLKPEKAPEKPKEGAAPAPVRMIAKILDASPETGPGVPKEVVQALQKLKGSALRYDFTAQGTLSNAAVELAKGSDEGLGLVVGALSDAIGTVVMPLPNKPVGKGAYWIAADRSLTASGMDVVRYRVFRVTDVKDGALTMSIDIRQYSASATATLPTGAGKPQQLGIEAFDSQGSGKLLWRPDLFLPMRGDITEAVGARLDAGGQQRAMLQTELTATVGGGLSVPE